MQSLPRFPHLLKGDDDAGGGGGDDTKPRGLLGEVKHPTMLRALHAVGSRQRAAFECELGSLRRCDVLTR